MEYNMPHLSFKNRLKNFVTSPTALNRLIVINVGIWLLYKLIAVLILPVTAFLMQTNVAVFEEEVVKILACPAAFDAWLSRPWTLITSLFFHTEFWHLFFNMLMLWYAGTCFRRYFSEKWLWTTYFIGGIVGNVCYQSAYAFFPAFADVVTDAIALGASGSIMAILAAGTLREPSYRIRLFPFSSGFKQIWLLVVFVVIDFLSIPKGNAGGHIAHLGGVLYGAVFTWLYAKSSWKFPSTFFHRKKKNKKEKFYTSYQNAGRPVSDEEYNAAKAAKEKRMDEILDKISKNGYAALTKEEKEFLFSESKRRNQ